MGETPTTSRFSTHRERVSAGIFSSPIAAFSGRYGAGWMLELAWLACDVSAQPQPGQSNPEVWQGSRLRFYPGRGIAGC